jgi:type IV fimbrial biogenesis protein FimT
MKKMAGFTLIELMITVVVLGIFLSLAIPSYSDWMKRLQMRNAAESILNGLQLARVEAIKRNLSVTMRLTGGTGWTVFNNAAGPVTGLIQTMPDGEGSKVAYIDIPTTPYDLTFNSLGRMTAPVSGINLSVTDTAGGTCTSSGPKGCFIVTASSGGLIRMCDPSRATGTPQGC